jgi:hypothetical protein
VDFQQLQWVTWFSVFILEVDSFCCGLQDVEVVSMSLTALNAVAFYHYQAICRGQEGLGVHVLSIQDTQGVVKEGVLAHFLRSVMQFLLFDDYRCADNPRLTKNLKAE